MSTTIPHSRPWINTEDHEAVLRVLRSELIGQGIQCQKLEQRLAKWVNAADGVAVASGAAAIVLALHGIGISEGDEVILPSYICHSVFEAVLSLRAIPVLCDVGVDWVITVDTAAKLITARTRAIIAPHIYGIFCDVIAIKSLGIPVIEDCAQAFAGEFQRDIQGDVAIFSFHPTKCLTSGEGGVAVSKDIRLAERMRAFRDGEATKLRARLFSPLSDIAASLVFAQLDRYPQMLARRQSIANRYREAFEKIDPESLNSEALSRSMFFRFPVRMGGGIDLYHDKFLKQGIHIRRGVDALLHRYLGIDDDIFPISVSLFNTTITLPIYPALTELEESHCIDSIEKI
ncbi:MAG: DegT/DnrJ/EryC1/StrS family aminotransferase, partial [Gallionellaceae bacterium]|nr:DegT/DnrJ/EryC1/StrS family aminotransferase [Gallionellaceae bacterium]